MPIPQFDDRGLLPAGVHVCTLTEFKIWAGSIPNAEHRLMLVEKFERFLNDIVRPIAPGWPLVIDGSFVTDKKLPNDIDFALDLRDCGDPVVLGEAFCTIFRGNSQNKVSYNVDGYVILPGGNDFQDFFGYVGQKTGNIKGINEKDRKGTLRVDQW